MAQAKTTLQTLEADYMRAKELRAESLATAEYFATQMQATSCQFIIVKMGLIRVESHRNMPSNEGAI